MRTLSLFTALLAFTLVTTGSEAATKPKLRLSKGTKAKRTVASEESTAQNYESATRTSPGAAAPLKFIAGPGVVATQDITGWAFNVGVVARVIRNVPFYAGLDLAYYNFNLPLATASMFQLLPTAYYQFDIGQASIRPFLGVSVGPTIATGGAVGAPTRVAFEGLIRPGVEFDVTKRVAINIESKFGILDGGFVVLPQATAVLPL